MAKEVQKQMALLREHLKSIESGDEEPVNQFLSDDETPSPEPKPEPAHLFLPSDSIDIEDEIPDKLDDLLAINEPHDLQDRSRRQTGAAVGVGQELREQEEKLEGFEHGWLAPAKLLAGSYRRLTVASSVQQWGATDNEQQSDGSPQPLAPAACRVGGEAGVQGGPAATGAAGGPAPGRLTFKAYHSVLIPLAREDALFMSC